MKERPRPGQGGGMTGNRPLDHIAGKDRPDRGWNQQFRRLGFAPQVKHAFGPREIGGLAKRYEHPMTGRAPKSSKLRAIQIKQTMSQRMRRRPQSSNGDRVEDDVPVLESDTHSSLARRCWRKDSDNLRS